VDKRGEEPHVVLGIEPDIVLCCCGPGGGTLKVIPLEKHSFGCLYWDWGVAVRMVTPARRQEQLTLYAGSIGDRG
jgi:hypothetical protein